MNRRPPRSTRTYTLIPDTTFFRSRRCGGRLMRRSASAGGIPPRAVTPGRHMTEPGELLWSPSPQRAKSTKMARFATRLRCPDYESLHALSVQETEKFWKAVWEECDHVGAQGDVVFDPGASMLEARFFPNATLS